MTELESLLGVLGASGAGGWEEDSHTGEGGREREGGGERTPHPISMCMEMGRTHNYTHDGFIIMQS